MNWATISAVALRPARGNEVRGRQFVRDAGRRLDVHRVVVLEEHDAHLPQPPTGKFFVLWGHIDLWGHIYCQGHRGDGADEAWSLPHRSTNGDRPEVDLFSLAALGQPKTAPPAEHCLVSYIPLARAGLVGACRSFAGRQVGYSCISRV